VRYLVGAQLYSNSCVCASPPVYLCVSVLTLCLSVSVCACSVCVDLRSFPLGAQRSDYARFLRYLAGAQPGGRAADPAAGRRADQGRQEEEEGQEGRLSSRMSRP